MSLTSYADEQRINPLDVVERLATGNDWSFERASDDEITILVTGKWTDYQLSYTWMGDIEALHLACAFDLKVPERRRAEVQALISLINERLWVGHFDLWTKEGIVMYRHALVLAGGVKPPASEMRICSAPRSTPASAELRRLPIRCLGRQGRARGSRRRHVRGPRAKPRGRCQRPSWGSLLIRARSGDFRGSLRLVGAPARWAAPCCDGWIARGLAPKRIYSGWLELQPGKAMKVNWRVRSPTQPARQSQRSRRHRDRGQAADSA